MDGAAAEFSLPQIRCFVAIADAGSIAAAARGLGISTASASKAIARLERTAGARLFHRSTHAVTLSAEGEALLDPARRVLAAADGWSDEVGSSTRRPGGLVRITAPVAFTRVVLAPMLADFARAHPDISLDVRASNGTADLADGAFDLAFRSGPLDRVPGHVQQRWFGAPWVVAAAPAYLAGRVVHQPEDLSEHRLIGFRNTRTGQVQGWPLRGLDGRTFNRAIDPALVFDDGESSWQAALAGAGVACAPLWLAAQALRDGTATELLPDHRAEPVDMALLRLDRRHTPARVASLVAHLLRHPPRLDDLSPDRVSG